MNGLTQDAFVRRMAFSFSLLPLSTQRNAFPPHTSPSCPFLFQGPTCLHSHPLCDPPPPPALSLQALHEKPSLYIETCGGRGGRIGKGWKHVQPFNPCPPGTFLSFASPPSFINVACLFPEPSDHATTSTSLGASCDTLILKSR